MALVSHTSTFTARHDLHDSVRRRSPRRRRTNCSRIFQAEPSGDLCRQSPARQKLLPSLSGALCNALESLVDAFAPLNSALAPSFDPSRLHVGNFAPVDELPPVACLVVAGSIPRCLRGGAYIRNGPNPQHLPAGPYHACDGDGMVHSLLLPRDGGTAAPAIFCSRYVRSNKYLAERAAGRYIVPNFVAGGNRQVAAFVARIHAGHFDPCRGLGTANTSVAIHGGRILALGEFDLPYAIRIAPDGDVVTEGRYDFGGELAGAMTAHQKWDPATKELFAFRYRLFRRPFLTYFWFDAQGRKQPDVPVHSLRGPAFLHDFAVTERHAIFSTSSCIAVRPTRMLLRGEPVLQWDPREVPRIGVARRCAAPGKEPRWYEAPGFSPTHFLNAWEDGGDAIVMVASNVAWMEGVFARTEARLERVRVGLGDGRVVRERLLELPLDFPAMNRKWTGRRNRYGYFAVGENVMRTGGAVKVDLERRGEGMVVGRREYGEGRYGGEPFFVPSSADGGGEEDDGYLVTLVHDERKVESRLLVMDAASRELEVVAEVLLPRRVPYGFHGAFFTEAELREQTTTEAAPSRKGINL